MKNVAKIIILGMLLSKIAFLSGNDLLDYFSLNADNDYAFNEYKKYRFILHSKDVDFEDFYFSFRNYRFKKNSTGQINGFSLQFSQYATTYDMGKVFYSNSKRKMSFLSQFGFQAKHSRAILNFELSYFELLKKKYKVIQNLKVESVHNFHASYQIEVRALLAKNIAIYNKTNSLRNIKLGVSFLSNTSPIDLVLSYNWDDEIFCSGLQFNLSNFLFKTSINEQKEAYSFLEMKTKTKQVIPYQFSSSNILIEKTHRPEYGTAAIILMPLYEPSFYEYKVKKGDNLNKISRHLPSNILEDFHNNPSKIATYNKIKKTNSIYIGQQLRFPTAAVKDSLKMKPELKKNIEKLLVLNETKNDRESAVLAANWYYLLHDIRKAEQIIPMFGDMSAIDYLNITAILAMEKQNFGKAQEFWSFALKQAPNNPILLLNAAQADYWMEDYDKAKEKIHKFNQNPIYVSWFNKFEEMVEEK